MGEEPRAVIAILSGDDAVVTVVTAAVVVKILKEV